jgi:hypothetical protein
VIPDDAKKEKEGCGGQHRRRGEHEQRTLRGSGCKVQGSCVREAYQAAPSSPGGAGVLPIYPIRSAPCAAAFRTKSSYPIEVGHRHQSSYLLVASIADEVSTNSRHCAFQGAWFKVLSSLLLLSLELIDASVYEP